MPRPVTPSWRRAGSLALPMLLGVGSIATGSAIADTPSLPTAATSSAAAATGEFEPIGIDTGDWFAVEHPPELAPLYTRSGPDERAAFYTPPAPPTLGAAQPDPAVHIADELGVDASSARREQLAEWGPWLSATGVSTNARQLLAFLSRSDAHGLAAEAYDHSLLAREQARREREATRTRLQAQLDWFVHRPGRDGDPSTSTELIDGHDPEALRLAAVFERSFTRLALALGRGVVDARSTESRLYRDPPEPDIDALLAGLADGTLDVNAALLEVMPTHRDYLSLVHAMDVLLEERATLRARTEVPDVGSLWVGHHHDDVMAIKRRLQETGDLAADAPLTPMFDAPLKLAIEAFQSRHGLPPAGIVDRRTRLALNTSVDEAIEQVAVNLERWRWMPRELGERHFFMNLPSYRLSMMNGRQRIVDMRVVIGAVKHPTPTFSREMSYVEVNPTWSVPASIAQRELLPKERARPGYLRERNFDFLKYSEGRYRRVAYDSVTRADLNARPFPYLIRQRGGANNALGRMKFMMPNPYAIYLHDTQAKSLFALDERAYSHGCIRLADPEHLLNVVLQVDGHSAGYASRLLAQSKTRRVTLDRPIPTHIVYLTNWIDEDGALQTRPDVYRRDDAVRLALKATDSLLSRPLGPRITARYGAYRVNAIRS